MSKEIPCPKCGHVWLWVNWKKEKDAFCPKGYGCASEDKITISDDLVKRALTDRIEKLEADRKKTYEALLKVTRIHDELETKLAKALRVLECYAGYWADDKTFVRTDDGGELASETIKELTGGKDE